MFPLPCRPALRADAAGKAGMPEFVKPPSIARGQTMRRSSRRAILAVAALAMFAGPARAEVKIADLVGHSLKISWRNEMVVKADDGGEDTHNTTTNLTLYVGEQKHVF